jgi:hypothetical protein
MGMLSIMMTKQKEALMASSGTCFAASVFFTLRDAIAQTGAMAAYPAAQVTGPR